MPGYAVYPAHDSIKSEATETAPRLAATFVYHDTATGNSVCFRLSVERTDGRRSSTIALQYRSATAQRQLVSNVKLLCGRKVSSGLTTSLRVPDQNQAVPDSQIARTQACFHDTSCGRICSLDKLASNWTVNTAWFSPCEAHDHSALRQ